MAENIMQARIFPSILLLLLLSASSCYAAGCGDMKLCVQNPPYPPDPPSCTTYPNYCAFIAPQLQVAPEKEMVPERHQQAPVGPGYSITLNNLSKSELDKILGQLGLDTSKVTVPPQ